MGAWRRVDSSSSRVPEGALVKKRTRCILGVTKHWLKDILNHENSVLQTEVQYATKTGHQTRALVTVRITSSCTVSQGHSRTFMIFMTDRISRIMQNYSTHSQFPQKTFPLFFLGAFVLEYCWPSTRKMSLQIPVRIWLGINLGWLLSTENVQYLPNLARQH